MTRRTFKQVWDFIKGMEGKKVRTLDRGYVNEIFNVTDEGVWRISYHSTSGGFTLVRKREFEKIWDELLRNGMCVARRSKAWRVACAILNELPEVTYSLRPLTLYLMTE